MRLQQAIGNRATGALLDPFVRDAYEREADTIAEQVMTGGVRRNTVTPLGGTTPATAAVHTSARSGSSHGRPMSAGMRASMEARFAAELGEVRIHDDHPAQTMADALDAHAFTIRDHVFLGKSAARESSPESQLLLAHELVHVLQQRAGGGLRIQRKPKSEQMVEATPQDKRQFIEDAIRFLHEMAAFYRAKTTSMRVSKKPAPFDPTKVLATWKKAIAGHLTIITTDLGGDKKLADDLQRSYGEAIREILSAAAASADITLHEAYEKYRGEIHEAGWPEGTVDPKSSDLSNAIPANERSKIQVISTTLVPVADLNIKGEFEARADASIAGSFSGTIPDTLKGGLKNIGVRMIAGMTPPVLKLNSTISLALDLARFGGDYALYRFTFWEHTEKRKRSKRLLVERLGALGIDEMKPSRATAAQKKFGAHNFKFKGVWRDAPREAVLAAVDLIADSLLTLVDGLSFARDSVSATDPEVAGNYDVKTHTITMFDRAFSESAVRFGPGAARTASPATFAVAHEIGHAVDRRRMRGAMVKEQRARETLRKNFGQFETSPDQFEIQNAPQDVLAEFNRQVKAVQKAGASVEAAKTESGVGFKGGEEVAAARRSTPFKTAAAGARISPRSLAAWEEYFAESFALFAIDPETLGRLRPRIHAYFVKTFTPPAPKTAPKKGGTKP